MPAPVDGKFSNPGHHRDRSWWEVLRWKLTSKATPWPDSVSVQTRTPPPPPAGGFQVTWINHATFLIQTPEVALLTDPHWSSHAGPFGRIGARRVHPPAVKLEQLPALTAVLLSHDHYDHCDLPTLRQLTHRNPGLKLITPLGHGDIARRAGFQKANVFELDWWGACAALPEIIVTATPARHWSNRLSGRRNGRLWSGFYLKQTSGRSLYFAGDTAYDLAMFKEIHTRLGAPDLALLPIGAYEPRWFMAEQHCNPPEAVQIHRDLQAQRSIGMHWGNFHLTDEGCEEPVIALRQAVREAQLPPQAFIAVAPGESVAV